MSCGRHCTHILIKLSPYQHPCCIMCLIASFCSIKSPIFAVFLHAFSIFDFLFSCCQFVCTPNGKTAEPDNYGRAAKVKERMGGKSFSGC